MLGKLRRTVMPHRPLVLLGALLVVLTCLPGTALWGIAIDHTLVTPGARIVQREVGPDLGSDHLPVRTRVAIGGGQAAR